jgi:hypothetical protein
VAGIRRGGNPVLQNINRRDAETAEDFAEKTGVLNFDARCSATVP